LIAVLPVVGLLVIGVGLLGVGTLKDLALVQLVGIASGAISSIFLATPLVVDLTMRRPVYRQQAERVAQRREKLARKATANHDDEVPAATTGSGTRAQDTMAAVAGVPARVGKTAPVGRRRGRPTGKSGRSSGKASRSSGR
jgi:preprotein translocase subunit SecF